MYFLGIFRTCVYEDLSFAVIFREKIFIFWCHILLFFLMVLVYIVVIIGSLKKMICMQSRVTFYVHTSNNGYVKLGSVKTVLDCSKPGVVDKIAFDLGVGGWNCYEVNGKMIVGGPGIKSEDIIYFVKNDKAKVMSLKYQSTVDMASVVVPAIAGYKYIVPVEQDEVVEEVAGEAPSKTEVIGEEQLMAKTVAQLIAEYPEFANIKMTKKDLVKAIIGKLN